MSLDELRELLEAQDARAALREEWRQSEPGAERRREMLTESLRLIDRQLALVRRRRDQIAALEGELAGKRSLVTRRLRELDGE